MQYKSTTVNGSTIFLLIIMMLISIGLLHRPSVTDAYIYSGYKWNGYPVSVDVSDSSWPISWSSALAGAMSAWNGASSPFYFNVGNSGHQAKTTNAGTGNPVAWVVTTVSGSTITDCDLFFNTSYSWSTSGSSSAYDVQNAATHELGHWLMLSDLYGAGDTEKTMYGYTSVGETKKRTLDSDDINGINAIYP